MADSFQEPKNQKRLTPEKTNTKTKEMTFNDLIESAPSIVKKKLTANKSLRERPDYHPEESAFEHIRIVTERLIPTGDMNLVFAGIFHDICKAETAEISPKTGFPRCPGHDVKAFDLIKETPVIQSFISSGGGDPHIVAHICLNHMRFHQLGEMRESKREAFIQRMTDQGIFQYLQIFGAADNMLVDFDINDLEKSFKFNRK